MDRNEESISHWNLNQNHTKCQGTQNTLGNIHKPKSICTTNRKSHTKLRGKYQFCWKCTVCTAVNYIKSLHWNLNDTVFLWNVKGNVNGIWSISKMWKEERESKYKYHSSRKSTVCVIHLVPFISTDSVNRFGFSYLWKYPNSSHISLDFS